MLEGLPIGQLTRLPDYSGCHKYVPISERYSDKRSNEECFSNA